MLSKSLRAFKVSLALGAVAVVGFSPQGSVSAQQEAVNDTGVYGKNVARADFPGGSFRMIGERKWARFDANGNIVRTYDEVVRDDWAAEFRDSVNDVYATIDTLNNAVFETDPQTKILSQFANITSVAPRADMPRVALPTIPASAPQWMKDKWRERFAAAPAGTGGWQAGETVSTAPPTFGVGPSQPTGPAQPTGTGQNTSQSGGGWGNNQQPQGNNDGGWGNQQQTTQQANNNGWGNQQQPSQQTDGDGWGNQQPSQQTNSGGWGNQQQTTQQTDNGGGWGNQQPAQQTGNAKPWETQSPSQGGGFGNANNSNGQGFGGGADAVDPFEEIAGVWVESNKPYRSEASNGGELVAWTGPKFVRFKKLNDKAIVIQSDLFAWNVLKKDGPGRYSGSGVTVSISTSGSSKYMQISGGRIQGSFEPARTADGGLSKDRFSAEVQGTRDDRRGLFNQDGLTREWNNNFHSYDALEMNLFNAASGRKVQIFKQPGSFDYAVDDNINLGLPYGLRGNRVRSSSSRQTEALITNAAEFQKSMSMSFGGGIKTPKGGFGANYSREKTAGTRSSSSSLNAIGIARIERYALVLDPPNIQLSDNFKRAVDQLAEGRMTARQFRETYGSHYSKAIVYGGLGKAEKTMTSQQIASFMSEKYKAGVQGDVKGANLNGSFGESKSSTNSNESVFTRDEFEAVGGSGSMSFSGWTVTDADTVPVRYDLRPLSDLINPVFFDISTYDELTKYLKAYNALNTEITRYMDSAPKLSNRTVGPRIYEIYVDRLYCNNKGDNDGNSANVYAKFSLIYRGDARDSQSITLMDSSSNGQIMFCGAGSSGAYKIGKTALVTVTPNSQYSGGGDHGWMGFVSTQASYEDEGWKDKQDPIAPLPGMGRLFPIASKADGKIKKESYGLYPAPNLTLEYTIKELK